MIETWASVGNEREATGESEQRSDDLLWIYSVTWDVGCRASGWKPGEEEVFAVTQEGRWVAETREWWEE